MKMSEREKQDLQEGAGAPFKALHEFAKGETATEIGYTEPLVNDNFAERFSKNLRPVKTPYNATAFPKYQEHNYQASETIPDQTMSVKEILERYAKGLPLTGQKEPIYHGEEHELPDLKRLDLSEIHELKNTTKEAIDNYRQEQAELNEKKKEQYYKRKYSKPDTKEETKPDEPKK